MHHGNVQTLPLTKFILLDMYYGNESRKVSLYRLLIFMDNVS